MTLLGNQIAVTSHRFLHTVLCPEKRFVETLNIKLPNSVKVRILQFSMKDSLTVARKTQLVDGDYRVNLVSISRGLTRTIQSSFTYGDNSDTVLKNDSERSISIIF